MQDLVSESLQIVGAELAVTFNDVRLSLEQYADGEKGPQSLEHCLDLLRTAIGVLRVTETYGAGLLTEEMEHTCRYLTQLRRKESGSEEAMEALSRAAVQLPAYVETIINGGRDIPLVLLPLLNDLRAARGKPLLSESTLLLLNVASPTEQQASVQSRKISGEDVAKLCRVSRPQFQLALLGWIKGMESIGSLDQIAEVAERLEGAAVTLEVYQLWWVVGGIVEALMDGGLETSVSLKRLLGQVDREMKRLMSVGESRYAEQPPTDLINNLLYYITRSTTNTPRVEAIRSAFNLSNLIPADDQVEMMRESLAAPSATLMSTVAEAIRDDLARVKDVLDIYVRTGMEHVEELGPQIDLLKKIGDTMGVLGLGQLREMVEAKRLELKKAIDKGEQIEENALMEMASALLHVEDHLEEQLRALIRPPSEESQEKRSEAADDDNDYAVVTRAVMRESVINLARVKDAVTQMLEKPGDHALLDSVPQHLRGIVAGLLIVEKEAAVSVVNDIGELIAELTREDAEDIQGWKLDLLADAMVSLEYYMETLQAGRKEPVYMLDNARACIRTLREGDKGAIPIISGRDVSGGATTMQAPGYASTIPSLTRPSESQIQTIAVSQGPGQTERVSPELIELFIEEAGEAIESINGLFPDWAKDENQHAALIDVRRAFHTLKGSGRVVGAALMGEFCWSVENLLNRLINNTVKRAPEIVEFLQRAIDLLPELLEQLEVGTAPKSDVQALMAEAEAFTIGQFSPAARAASETRAETDAGADAETVADVAAATAAEADADAAAETVAESGAADIEPETSTAEKATGGESVVPELDPLLIEILSKETDTHLAAINKFIGDCRTGASPFAITEELHRACHTLHGSVTMARAEPAARITEPLNQLVRNAFDHGLSVDESVIFACADAAKAIGIIVDCLTDASRELPDFSGLQARLTALDEDIETRVAMAATEERADDTVSVSSDSDLTDAMSGDTTEAESPASADSPETPSQPEFDAEVAAIFSEEAMEILECIDAALNRSSDGQISETTLAELQRYLHTLKGGARMVGLLPMGDLSHDLETLLLRITSGQLQADAARLALLQETVDELHRLSEKMTQGVVASPPPQLTEELHAALVEAPDQAQAEERPAQPPEEPPEERLEAEPVKEDEVADRDEAESEQEGPAEPTLDMLRPLPADTQLGQLARELQEPARPESRDVADLIQGAPPDVRVPERREFARIDPGLLEQLLNNAGEVSIFHSRLSQQTSQIQFNLDELGQTVLRLREQLRGLEIATEAQILYQHGSEGSPADSVDPLKLERYSKIQQYSRALSETANDVSSLKDLLQNLTSDTDALLVQQARTAGELQDGLMRTRMVPFEQHAARLSRIVRQMTAEHGKQAELSLQGGGEIDRQVLEKMLPPLEHMVRNAIIHGIEAPAVRAAAGKPAVGNVGITVQREGAQVLIEIEDDGKGMDVELIRKKAVELGLTSKDDRITDEEVQQFVLRSGFSTAARLTQASGRGIGMDVVANEVAKLGGTLQIDTRKGEGTRISVRLPFTLAVTQALIVRAASELYALPLPTVEGIIRISRSEFREKMLAEEPGVDYGDQRYRLRYLGQYLGLGPAKISDDEERISIILVRAGANSTALVTDEMLDSREIIVKPIGPQLASIRGIAGATILGDGSIALILDAGALVRSALPHVEPVEPVEPTPGKEAEQPLALIVDDSITMRRVSQRLLERNGLRVLTARDGVQAVDLLRDHRPDIILLDIEMPRMDGYEFASFVRNNAETEDVPIIMITSRVSDEHKARAIELGVNDYLGKPYQESVLMGAVRNLLKID